MKILFLIIAVACSAVSAYADDCGKLSDAACVKKAALSSTAYSHALMAMTETGAKISVDEQSTPVSLIVVEDSDAAFTKNIYLVSFRYQSSARTGTDSIHIKVTLKKASTDAPIDINVGEVYNRTIERVAQVVIQEVK